MDITIALLTTLSVCCIGGLIIQGRKIGVLQPTLENKDKEIDRLIAERGELEKVHRQTTTKIKESHQQEIECLQSEIKRLSEQNDDPSSHELDPEYAGDY